MGEKRVRDPAEPLARLPVVVGDRLVGAVPARHHERPARVVEEQVVERSVRKHQPEQLGAGRDRRRDGRVRPAAQQDDRPLARLEQGPLLGVDDRERPGLDGHDGERLLLPELPSAQARDRGLVGRVAGEVVAAEALDRQDAAPAQELSRALERHREPRPADGAADRLGVEAAVGRVLVLAAAVRAERERGHGRVRPVVGHGLHDREPWSALRAVDERVPVPPVGRVEQLAQAVVAGGDVGGDQSRATARHALEDPEPALADRLDRLCRDRVDAGERGWFCNQIGREAIDLAALDLDQDALPVVEDEAGEPRAGAPARARTAGSRRPGRRP